MQNKGWVKLWREQFTHEVSERKPWCDGYAWSYLYSQANYKPGIANFRNQYIPIERGQFVTSKLKLQEIFGWSKKRINSFLTSLEVRGMSTNRTTNRFIMITICNYEKYQGIEDENETTDVTTEGPTEGPTESQQSDTIKEVKNKRIYVEGSTELRLASFLLEEIQKNKPDFKQPNLQAWAKDIDLMIRRDGRVTDRIREVIVWAQGDSFWRKNILSTGSLRDKFDRLELAMQEKSTQGSDRTTQYQDLTGRGSA